MHRDGKLALKCYLAAIVSILGIDLVLLNLNLVQFWTVFLIFSSTVAFILVILKVLLSHNDYEIALRASVLGSLLSIGLYIKLATPSEYSIFGAYMIVMSFFHLSEYLAISVVQPKELSVNSFVINHSPQYVIAAMSSWVEFAIEVYFVPGLKSFQWLSTIGLIICILGEILRKIAMLTAGSSFNHLVMYEKPHDHRLVTHGVYNWFRHPSYVGWFYWSIGTQITLLNPLCIIAYTLASWFFFNSRIYMEEITLLNFYGQAYCDYQKRVSTGLPFNKGYRIDG